MLIALRHGRQGGTCVPSDKLVHNQRPGAKVVISGLSHDTSQ